MPDSVDSPAPLRTTTPPPAKSSTRIPNGSWCLSPRTCVSTVPSVSPCAPSAASVTPLFYFAWFVASQRGHTVAESPTARAPIGVGIVGLSAGGGWAARAHVPALAAVPGVELRALSASSAESAKAAGDKYGVALTYSSVEELAACDEVDLVAVTVKVTHHYELVMAALRAGK